MIPPYELRMNHFRSAYKKVAEWITGSDTYNNTEDNELSLSVPADFGIGFANFCISRRRGQNREPSPEELEKQTNILYQTVIDTLKGENIRLSNLKFSTEEKTDILSSLTKKGFNVPENDFYEVIMVAKAVRDWTLKPKRRITKADKDFRHASLNCYDYERFKSEFNELTETIGYKGMDISCPTLVRIAAEASQGENLPYPGRHLPYENTTWSYHCLRVMDEAFCSSEKPVSSPELVDLIISRAKEHGIEVDDTIRRPKTEKESKGYNDNVIRKLRMQLSDMLKVEHMQGKKEKYNHAIFEPGKNGYFRYNKFKDERRLCAFMVDISAREAHMLRIEIGRLRAGKFSDDRDSFAARFPLISTLGYMEELALEDAKTSELVNKLANTDLLTINYKQSKFPGLKKKVGQAVKLSKPIAVKQSGKWEVVFPLEVRNERDNWVLISRTADSRLLIITPEELNETFNPQPAETIEADYTAPEAKNIIGLGRLLDDKPYEVTIAVTERGREKIEKENSAFYPLRPEIGRNNSRYYKRVKTYSATFTVYLNEDFLGELLKLDKACDLESVDPEPVNELYEAYFMKVIGKERVPLQDRPVSTKTIKAATKKVKSKE